MKYLSAFIIFFASCNGAKILGIFNHPAPSHTKQGIVLLKNLARKGHEVVMMSSYPLQEPVHNYRDISLPHLFEDLKKREMMYFEKRVTNALAELRNMTMYHTELTFTEPGVQELLKSNETFDIIVMDYFFNEATLIFAHRFQAPVILMSSFGNNPLFNQFTGNSLPFSYIPGAEAYMDDNMSLKHRLLMTFVNIFFTLVNPFRYRSHHAILKRHFENPPTIEELKEKVALVLALSHFSFETPRPYTPNIIPVGGFHVEDPKPLSKDLKEFLDSAENGVILFGLGSQIKSSNLDHDKIRQIVNVFSKLPQKVLWKYETDEISLPSNVKIVKWLPQVDVLAHPSVKLFITHAGLLSTVESIHFNRPILCIPFNGDQLTNCAFIASREIGLKMSFEDINEEILYDTIQKLINNPKYQNNTNYYSSLLREQPVKPIDLAMYWVEHVIKFKGAPHLRPFSLNLPWYKYYLIDIIAIVGLTVILSILLTVHVLKTIFSVLRKLFKKLSKRKTE